MSAIIAIVGRPNVGKSTLFNRLVGKRHAIESAIAGTTRDRLIHSVDVEGYPGLLVDTGGLELGKPGEDLEDKVQEQSKIAIQEADVILFVVDVRAELTAQDFYAAELLRKSKKTVILVANKADNPDFADLRYNLYELHFGDPIAVTAIHADGLDELMSRIAEDLKKLGFEKKEARELEGDNTLKISFLGRPNVGKSTMINAILGETRLVTSAKPGTTRDSTHVPFKYKEEEFTLVDTAGVRRRGSIEKGLEKYSILRTFQAVELSDICVLLLDAEEGITKQDCHVSEFILNEKKGLILVLNKFDQFKGEEKDEREDQLIRELRHKMDYIPWAPVVFTSALRQKNVFHVLDLAMEIKAERSKKIPQSELTIWLGQVLRKHPPVGTRGKRRFSVLSVEQIDVNPPQFVFNCNWPEIMHFSYGRYLENELRSAFGFTGTALQLTFRKPDDVGTRRPSTKGRRRVSSTES